MESTIGVDFYLSEIDVKGKKIKVGEQLGVCVCVCVCECVCVCVCERTCVCVCCVREYVNEGGSFIFTVHKQR